MVCERSSWKAECSVREGRATDAPLRPSGGWLQWRDGSLTVDFPDTSPWCPYQAMTACLNPTRSAALRPRASTRLVRVELSFGSFDALHAEHLHQRFAPHLHEFFAIGVIEAGANRLDYRNGWSVASAGAIVAIPPGELHTGTPVSEEGWTYRMVYPSPEFVSLALAESDAPYADPVFFTEAVLDDALWGQRFVRLHEELFAGGCNLSHEERLLELLRQLAVRHAAPRAAAGPRVGRSAAIAARAREYLHAHYAKQVSLAELSVDCGVSSFHLNRVFRRAVGLPPHAYLKQLRVSRAQAMLQRGASVAAAAYSCGFSDQSHLTRTFKSVVGVPPGAYARGIRDSTKPQHA
jgi:AraC-like DNA-binding protein